MTTLLLIILASFVYGSSFARGERIVIMEQTFREIIKESDNQETRQPVTETGHAINCGPPQSKLELSWDPKNMDKDSKVQVKMDMIAPVDFERGNIKAEVYSGDTFIFDYQKKVTCQIAERVFTGMCPKGKININDQIKASTVYSDFSKFPRGTFTVIANVTNQENQLFMCAKITFTVGD